MGELESKQANPEQDSEGSSWQRRIRSFVLRQGRLTKGQERAIAQGSARYVQAYQAGLLDWDTAFKRSGSERILEIGFGMGNSTAEIALGMPEKDFIAVEVHTPGVGSLLKLMLEQGIDNIRIIQHDAVEVLQHMMAPNSLDGVHIFFPDPWHKKRHHKRRLIQAEFVELLVSRLKPGAYLHVATDWQEYAEWIMEVLSAQAHLVNSAGAQQYAEKPAYRPMTKFEQRGINLGHGVWDLVFVKPPAATKPQ
jgi:tRNA (guanine-N7-)-methyltransferase